MRSRFDEQLLQLNVELIKMGSLCELVISNAFHGLIDNNPAMLKLVADVDREIDEKEKEIERMCLKLLLQQQPVARDLRLISAALKMITDMERIGDQVSDIVEIMGHRALAHTAAGLPLRDMFQNVVAMTTNSVEAFVKKDLELARMVNEHDEIVDRLFDITKFGLIDLMTKGGEKGEDAIDLLMIAKYLERIGDHATNIAEWVEFSITGAHPQEM